MLKKHMAACLIVTALIAVPAFAQTSAAPPGGGPAARSPQTPAVGAEAKTDAGDFVNKAANGNMFEIQSSQLALQKSQETRIRDFAQKMVHDHTQAGDKMTAAAKDQTVPTSLDQEHAQMLQQLQQASGSGFNRSYVQMQFDGHQKTVALFEQYAQNGDHAQLKEFAQQTLPTLREHFQMITDIRKELLAPERVAQAQPRQAGSQSGQFITEMKPNTWRLSKLKGLDVYNSNNEKIGDVNEILVDRNGKAENVVIGVGGFLGLGERDVAIPFNALQWAMDRRDGRAASRTGTSGDTGSPAPASRPDATASVSRPSGVNGQDREYPDHAVLANATKDQLKSAPEFRYSGSR
jgi:predicted outer membrane protein/sporulation protein YlmC with PRC-barrel domain